MPATPITNHIDQALAKTIQRFKNKPRFAAWVASHVRQFQRLEDAIWPVINAWDVDTCDLARLTVLGKIVGQAPIGTLEQFRLYVKVRIAVNRSRGRIPDVLQIARALLGAVTYVEGTPAYFEIHAGPLDPLTQDPNVAAGLLREAKAAGVGMGLVYNTTAAPSSTWLVGSYTADTDAARGGSYDGTTGGVGAAFA